MIKTMKSVLLGAAFLMSTAAGATAAEHVINMLNKGADGQAMVFEPAYVKAAVGDTVRFVPVDKGHFAVVLPGMWPEGVAEAKGKMNQEFTVTLEKDGIYGFKCTPHYAMGMVAMVQVGTATVTDEMKAKKLPGKAGERMAKIYEMAAAAPADPAAAPAAADPAAAPAQ
jgi:pseudoazurin